MSEKCDVPHTYLCYDEDLVLVKENKTWEEALEHCRTLKEGNRYDLATLITPDDHNYARERAQYATTEEVGRCLLCTDAVDRLILLLCGVS